MKAVSRFGWGLLAAGLALVPAITIAQQAPTTATPPPDSVGPKALQDFSLSGTVTRQADQPAAVSAAPATRQPEPAPAPQPSSRTRSATVTGSTPKHVQTAAAPAVATPKAQAVASPELEPSSAPAALAPAAAASGTTASPLTASPSFAPTPESPGVLASSQTLPMLGWLLAALAILLGAGFFFWRSRARPAYAGGTQFDLFTGPEPAPEPSTAPSPAPRAAPRAAAPPPAAASAAPPKPAPGPAGGIVSARLRPWIEIGFQPIRCVIDDQRVMVEFDLDLFNSGSGPARALLVEARLFNASADQDAQIADFFANPVGTGDRIAVIQPLKRLTVRSQAVVPRDQLMAYELAGHPVFVPLIGFNALYSWSGGEGQTSVSHLIGRDTKGEKLAPFRLDLGPHIFRNLAARLLPTAIRR